MQHGPGDGNDVVALVGDVGDFLAEDGGPGTCGGLLQRLAGFRVDDADGVELVGLVGAGRRVAAALLGQHVDDDRPGEVLGLLQGFFDSGLVVPVDGAEVLHAEVLEKPLRRPPVLDALLGGVQRLVGELAHGAGILQADLELVHGVFVGRTRPELVELAAQARELVGQAADGRRVGAAVVVDDDDHPAVLVGGDVVDGFPGHAAGQRPVADQGHDVAVRFAGELAGAGNSVGPGKGGGRVRGFDDVVHGFGAFRVAGKPALLAQRGEVTAVRSPACARRTGVRCRR